MGVREIVSGSPEISGGYSPGEPFTVPDREDLIWVGVDLDSTIAEPVWPAKGIGEPIWENVYKLEELVEHGYKIIIYTARGWEDVELVESWLAHHQIPFNRVVCGKVLLRAMVDDKNIHPDEESWLPNQ